MGNPHFLYCYDVAQQLGMSQNKLQETIREYDIPYWPDDLGDYRLPANVIDLLIPHLFLTHSERKARSQHRAMLASVKERSKAAKKRWETRREKAAKSEQEQAWNTYGYELFRSGM